MQLQIKKPYIIIAIGLVGFLGILLLTLISSGSRNPSSSSHLPSSTTPQATQGVVGLPTGASLAPEQSEGYVDSVKKINATEAPQIQHDAVVGQLIHKLPYTGTNFSLDFTFSTNQFLLRLNKANSQQGIEELKTFLKQNGIDDPSWLRNVSSSYY